MAIKNDIRWVETSVDKDNNTIIPLYIGEQGEKIALGMNSAIAEYAKQGNNVIVDYIAYKQSWVNDLQEKLKEVTTYWVKVNISLEELERREEKRGTSPKGHARSHYDSVHNNIVYDFQVNSEENSAKEIAEQLKKFIENKEKK